MFDKSSCNWQHVLDGRSHFNDLGQKVQVYDEYLNKHGGSGNKKDKTGS